MQGLRRIGARAWLVVLLATASSAAAASAAENTLVAHGPHRVKTNDEVHLRFTGHRTPGVPSLWVLLDDRSCAADEQVEARRKEIRREIRVHVARHFTALLTVRHSIKGTHFVCGYLVHKTSGRTVARASLRYVTS